MGRLAHGAESDSALESVVAGPERRRHVRSNGAPIISFQVFCCSSLSLATTLLEGFLAVLGDLLHGAFAVVLEILAELTHRRHSPRR